MKITGFFKAWSYSRYSDYDKCPYLAALKHLMKQKEPPNKAMERGIHIDQAAQGFLEGKIAKLPPELKLLGKEYKEMKALKPKCNQQWALDINWNPADWFDWDNAWVRIKMDAEARAKGDPTTLWVDDTKSGKPRGGYGAQLALYALGGFMIYPLVKKVRTRLLFTDHGPDATVIEEYDRKNVPAMKADWMKKIKAMFADRRFAPKPGNYCTWCHFRKENGGPCKF